MITFKTLEQVKRRVSQQATAQQLLNRRMSVKGQGWVKIALSEELEELICNQVSELLGGHHKTRAAVYNNLMRSSQQHWGLDRVLVEQYGKSKARLSYCAGQDYTSELNTIRTVLK